MLSVHDEGFDALCEDGSTARLRCHAMASRGDELLTCAQFWLQRGLGVAWVNGAGFSVADEPDWRPCRPRPVPPPRPAARIGPPLDGVRAALDCTRAGRGHHLPARAHARLVADRDLAQRVDLTVDGAVVLTLPNGSERRCWLPDLPRLEDLLRAYGNVGLWLEECETLGLPGWFDLEPVSLLRVHVPGTPCRGSDEELLLP